MIILIAKSYVDLQNNFFDHEAILCELDLTFLLSICVI